MDYTKCVEDEYINDAIQHISEAIKSLNKLKYSEEYNLSDYRVALENIMVDLETELEG